MKYILSDLKYGDGIENPHRVQNVIYLHLFTELLHDDFSSMHLFIKLCHEDFSENISVQLVLLKVI